MIKILLFIFFWVFCAEASLTYTAINCANLNKYRTYLQTAKKGVLQKHPKCNAAAIKKAYKNDESKKKWVNEIEALYQAYFEHPSSIFRDCNECISKAPFYKLPTLEQRQSKKYVLVLSTDGGGVKGLVPAKVLEHIEKRTGKKISEIFDIFVGTSTGGLISLFLNTPTETGEAAYDAEQLVQMYRELSSSIFSHPNFLRKLRGTKGVLTAKYSAKPYEQLLKRYFRNSVIRQTINPVLVTSVDIENQQPFFFSTIEAAKGRQENLFIWEGGRATSAAPTYFKPYKLRTRNGILTLVDGGVGINNPSTLGITLAKELYPGAKILLVSLSTKVSQGKARFRTSGPFGGGSLSLTRRGANVGALVDNLLDVPSQVAEETSKKQLEAEGSTYIRIEVERKVHDVEMDDGSLKALAKLEKIAEEVIQNNKELKHLLTLLPSYIDLKEKESLHRRRVSDMVRFYERRG